MRDFLLVSVWLFASSVAPSSADTKRIPLSLPSSAVVVPTEVELSKRDLEQALQRYEQIMSELASEKDPDAAAQALADRDFLWRLDRADPAKANKLLERAGTLVGMHRLFVDNQDIRGLDGAWYEKRTGYLPILKELGLENVSDVAAWLRRFTPEAEQRFLKISLEWSTLSPKQRDFVSAPPYGYDEARWQALPLTDRAAFLGVQANLLAEQVLREGRVQVNDEDAWILWYLSEKRRDSLALKIAQHKGLHDQLAKLEGIDKSQIPPDLLAKAQDSSAPLEERLAALSRIFENRGADNQGVGGLVPLPQDRKLSAERLAVLDSMLTTAYPKALAKVTGDLKDIFVDRARGIRFKVVIRDAPNAALEYLPSEDLIVLGRETLDKWLGGHGWSEQDLITRPEIFDKLVAVTTAVIGHERYHQISDHWKRDQLGLPEALPFFTHVQEDEAVANLIEAHLFNVQLHDAAFLALAKEELSWSPFVRGSAAVFSSLRKNPREFMSGLLHYERPYSQFPTIDDAAAGYAQRLDHMPAGPYRDHLRSNLVSAYRQLKDYYGGDYDRIVEAWVRGKEKFDREHHL